MKKRLPIFLLVFVFLVSLALNMRGINWAQLAPDENQIASWMSAMDKGETLFIRNRVYPEGFFAFAKALRVVDRQCDKISSHIADWQRQNAEKSSRNGADADMAAGSRFPVRRIRRINAWLGATASAFVFLMLLEMFGSPVLACVGALLFAFHPFLIEHAHYAETDMMMVLMETLALWLMTLALKRGNAWLFTASAFLTGAAVASKFSLTPMLFLLPPNAVIVMRRRGKGWGTSLAFAVASLLVATGGFVAFTPKLWHAPALWIAQYGAIKRSAYGELEGLLGEDIGKPYAATMLRMRFLLKHARFCGLACWMAVAVSLPLWCRRECRPFVTGMPLFGAAYLAIAALTFPWFRTQEFLPALPFLAASAILPLAVSLRLRNIAVRYAALAASLVLLLAVSSQIASAGILTTNSFTATETRLAFADWIDCSAAEGKTWITEFYTTLASPSRYFRQGKNRIEGCSKLERIMPGQWDEINCDYFVVANNFIGRGIFSPLTGKRFPACQEALDHIMADAIELNRWSLSDGLGTTFSQADVSLYANHAGATPEVNLRRFLFQPALVKGKWWGNSTVRISQASGLLGPLEGVHVIGKRTDIEFQPLPPGQFWYAVAVNQSGGAPVAIDFARGFSPGKQLLQPGEAGLFVSNKSLLSRWRPVPSTRVRLRGNDHVSRCTAFFTRDASMAAALLRFYGNEAAAASIAPPAAGDDGVDRAAALLENGDSNPSLAVNGIPARIVHDFSRARVDKIFFIIPDAPLLAKFKEGFIYADVPLSLCAGDCTFAFKLRQSRVAASLLAQQERTMESFDLIGARLVGAEIGSLDKDMNLDVTLRIRGSGRYMPLYLGVKSPDETATSCEAISLELTWNPADAIRAISANRLPSGQTN